MNKIRIFITGASGCVGSYLVDELLKYPQYHLTLLVRAPNKIRTDIATHPNVTIIDSDLLNLKRYTKDLKETDYLFHIATVWGGNNTFEVNFRNSLKLFKATRAKQIFYFSTASILNNNHQLLPQAKYMGTEYIKSKALCYEKLSQSELHSKIIYLFPTLIFGGDPTHPFTHLSQSLPHLKRWSYWLRFLKSQGSFHFIHAQDIAKILVHLLNQHDKQHYVLGQAPLTVNQTIQILSHHYQYPIPFSINLEPWIEIIKKMVWHKMTNWDRYCLEQRELVYDAVNPESFGMRSFYPDLKSILQKIK